ncbi:MAG: hypothetical protein CMI95_03710 [Pelagibacteraceae bacterium]|nr:hypothetical protein [Pelagibacteraceae bacterium]|tara:strand:+ start:20040 stop:20915 length:876 start_codon:yes stop_codon:yes gene_type:complete
MANLMGKLYFFSKLSTSIILLFLLLAFIYLFSKSFLDQKEDPNIDLEKKITAIDNSLNDSLNKKNIELNQILKKIEKIESDLVEIKNIKSSNNNIDINNKISDLSKKVDALTKIKQDLKTNNISINQTQKEVIKKHLEDIDIKLEQGLGFNNIIEKLFQAVETESAKNLLEKLSLYSNGNILSYEQLILDFEVANDLYLKQHFFNHSKSSRLTRFFLKFFSIKPDNKNLSQDNLVNSLSVAANNLKEKRLDKTIIEINKIHNQDKFFNNWLVEAKKYSEASKLILLISEDL